MANEQDVSVREALNRALIDQSKQLILGMLDQETLRQYLFEETAKALESIIGRFDLEKAIREVVDQQVRSELPKVVAKVLKGRKFKEEAEMMVATALRQGVASGCGALARRLSDTIGRM